MANQLRYMVLMGTVIGLISACGLLAPRDSASASKTPKSPPEQGSAPASGNPAAEKPAVADPTPTTSSEWETRCQQFSQDAACPDEYNPHLCKLGNTLAQGLNRCLALSRLQKNLCHAKDFSEQITNVNCSPTQVNLKEENTLTELEKWTVLCKSVPNISCTLEHSYGVCRLGKLSQEGSNPCMARVELLRKVCAQKSFDLKVTDLSCGLP